MSGRVRVEHAAAGDGRRPAQDDAVVARGDERRGQPQLGEALAGPDDARRDGGGAVMDVEARAVLDRLELRELDVEPVARPEAARA